MDPKIFLSTFLLVFLAELGDKTQLAVIALSAREKTPVTIFVSAVLGFAAATAIAIMVGIFGVKFLPINIIEKAVAAVFIVVGILIFFDKI